MSGLNLATLRAKNVERQKLWDPHGKIDLSFRGNELGGEIGEAQNVIKKLERERLGIVGRRDTVEHLAEELADGVIVIDLIAAQAGIDLANAVREKFNAKSNEHGLPVFINAVSDAAELNRLAETTAKECADRLTLPAGEWDEMYFAFCNIIRKAIHNAPDHTAGRATSSVPETKPFGSDVCQSVASETCMSQAVNKPSPGSIEIASRIWCRPDCANIEMDVRLANAFAQVIHRIWSQPWLGNATTKQLLDEVAARVDLNYKTVDDKPMNMPPSPEPSPEIINALKAAKRGLDLLNSMRQQILSRTNFTNDVDSIVAEFNKAYPWPNAVQRPRNIEMFVTGTPTHIESENGAALRDVVRVALIQAKNIDRPIDDWELRDCNGKLYPTTDSNTDVLSDTVPDKLFLNLKAGVQG